MDVIDQNIVIQTTLVPGVNDAPSPTLPITWLTGVEWVKDDSQWCCKVKDCAKKYNTKWLLTTHLKKMHSLATKKGFSFNAP